MSWLIFINSFLVVVVCLNAKECEEMEPEYLKCLKKLNSKDGVTSNIANVNHFLEECGSKLDAIKCTKDYVSKCKSAYDQAVIETTIGDQMKLIETLCDPETPLNKVYLDNKECWSKTEKEVELCNSKFQQSLQMTMASTMESDMKNFHTCCAFNWLKRCKTKIVEIKCNEEAMKHIGAVTDMIFGTAYQAGCDKITDQVFENCHELYGVEVADLEDLSSSSNALQIPYIMSFLLLILTQLRFS